MTTQLALQILALLTASTLVWTLVIICEIRHSERVYHEDMEKLRKARKMADEYYRNTGGM